MTVRFTVDANPEQISDAISLFKFVGGNMDNAVRIGINKALPKVRSGTSNANNASKKIREQIAIKASYITGDSGIKIEKATRQKLSGKLTTPTRGLLLSYFETSAKASLFGSIFTPDYPIKVRVKPGAGNIQTVTGDPNEVYGDPFYIRLRNSGGYGIAMWRRVPGPKGGRVKVFYGPSLSQVFNTVRDDILPASTDIYQAELLDAMRYLLAKQYPPE